MELECIYYNLKQLATRIGKISGKKKIVYTYGAWDLLHPGHIEFLLRAKKLGNFLIVGVVSDAPIKNLKGNDRPFQNQSSRLKLIGNIKCVDAAIPQKNYDPSYELNKIARVDILTKGDDWDYIPGEETIIGLGGQLVKLSYTDGFSTSNLAQNIRHNLNKNE